ncbi:MAG TPA: aminoacyl-histidine dipeptidase [Sphingobacterium sp.]|jgi:dipeptidase D|nr:aminoacyl-histidine dipeptidase [Sphingobacterium sp.]
MDKILEHIEPRAVWQYFEQLNAVPRGSKKEDRIVQFMLDFGTGLGLEALKDDVGNVLIRKDATAGMGHCKTVILQSHLDMVHQKNNDTVFDFENQGITMYVDGDWVKAKGTTLGADNGLGVAAIMAVLASTDIAHPPLEALFTIDEETGMTGAKGLQKGLLNGSILLNLDTEDDSEIDIGCAGGVDITARISYTPEAVSPGSQAYTLAVKGLKGGHSGMDIHKGLGNANKILNRILFELLPFDIRLAGIEGGGLRNAIPRESTATLVVGREDKEALFDTISKLRSLLTKEYGHVEPELAIQLVESLASPEDVVPRKMHEKLIKAIYAAPNGVYRMSPAFDGLVETSNNIARVDVGGGNIVVKCLTRSSVESSKEDLSNALRSCFELAGAHVELSGDYPGWTPDPDSAILRTVKETYMDLFGEEPQVVACHAGLECGILAGIYPGIDMVSFGPTIRGAHSPEERVSISSVRKFWSLLLAVLRNTPASS